MSERTSLVRSQTSRPGGGGDQAEIDTAVFRYMCLPLYEIELDAQLLWGGILRTEFHHLAGVDITEELRAYQEWHERLQDWYAATAQVFFGRERQIMSTLLDIHCALQEAKARADNLTETISLPSESEK